ncbi:lysophospholipid acyltransferase family protein [Xanthomonas indica]|uniref:Lysophospholipid acyltransferase family protein n=1 Tax=Xanthomonas indica TaxID=2912242 RepID=A0AAU8IB45_9XANT|nr:lysophospholipid acyltransferase family protein [Xanthomonas indica]MCI2261033.1 lysophospholipid acyltransferase family protein [Xanthomonas indica]
MVKPSRFMRWLGRTALRVTGWRVVGEFPNVPKLVMIVAPHSSNWDGFLGFAVKFAVGFEVRVLGKTQLFWWPLGPLLRKLGGIPLDRTSPRGVVEQAVALIRGAERMWYVITPEGTRKRVEKWKTGFWKIAHGAQVPIFPVYFDYPSRTVGLGEVVWTSEDMQADIAAIREWYRPWRGKHRDTL